MIPIKGRGVLISLGFKFPKVLGFQGLGLRVWDARFGRVPLRGRDL